MNKHAVSFDVQTIVLYVVEPETRDGHFGVQKTLAVPLAGGMLSGQIQSSVTRYDNTKYTCREFNFFFVNEIYSKHDAIVKRNIR